jgi:hypothetical protein
VTVTRTNACCKAERGKCLIPAACCLVFSVEFEIVVWKEEVQLLNDSDDPVAAWKPYEDQAQEENAFRIFKQDFESDRFADSGEFAATVCALRHVTHSRGRCSCHLFVCALICVCRREREEDAARMEKPATRSQTALSATSGSNSWQRQAAF